MLLITKYRVMKTIERLSESLFCGIHHKNGQPYQSLLPLTWMPVGGIFRLNLYKLAGYTFNAIVNWCQLGVY